MRAAGCRRAGEVDVVNMGGTMMRLKRLQGKEKRKEAHQRLISSLKGKDARCARCEGLLRMLRISVHP
jgi:hypothetical protein